MPLRDTENSSPCSAMFTAFLRDSNHCSVTPPGKQQVKRMALKTAIGSDRSKPSRKLIFPEILEPIERQSRIADRGHDRTVAEIGLDGASVMAVVGELEPTGMPQHVGVDKKAEFRSHARPGHHALISSCGKRSATFRDEDVGRCWCFAQELAQCSALPG